jgi:hypothetical protein
MELWGVILFVIGFVGAGLGYVAVDGRMDDWIEFGERWYLWVFGWAWRIVGMSVSVCALFLMMSLVTLSGSDYPVGGWAFVEWGLFIVFAVLSVPVVVFIYNTIRWYAFGRWRWIAYWNAQLCVHEQRDAV